MENTKELINVTNALIFALKIDGKKDKANTELIAEAERIVKLFAIPDVSVPLPTDKEIDSECNERFAGNLAPTYFKLGAEWVRGKNNIDLTFIIKQKLNE